MMKVSKLLKIKTKPENHKPSNLTLTYVVSQTGQQNYAQEKEHFFGQECYSHIIQLHKNDQLCKHLGQNL